MHARRRNWIVGTALGLLGALGLTVWLLLAPPVGQRQRLPDGSVWELRGVTYGREHRFVWGNAVQRLLLDRGYTWAGGTVLDERTRNWVAQSDTVALWFASVRPPTQRLQYLWGEAPEWATVDSHGCRIAPGFTPTIGINNIPRFADSLGALVGASPGETQPILPGAWPRREATLRYALHAPRQPEPLAVFTTSNRPVSPAREWQPQALPQTRSSGGTRFTLQRMAFYPERSLGERFEALFASRDPSGLQRGWEPENILVTDATGNAISSNAPWDVLHQGRFAGLCRKEPTWRLRVDFHRPERSLATPDVTWVVRNLLVPRRNRVAWAENARVRRSDFDLTLRGILGPGEIAWSNAAEVSDVPRLILKGTARVDPVEVVLLRVTMSGSHGARSGSGRIPLRQPLRELRSQFSARGEEVQLPLDYPSGTRRLNLTLGIYRTRRVEFLVKPP